MEEREETGLEMHLLSKQFLSMSDLIRLMKAIRACWEAESSAQHLCMTHTQKKRNAKCRAFSRQRLKNEDEKIISSTNSNKTNIAKYEN